MFACVGTIGCALFGWFGFLCVFGWVVVVTCSFSVMIWLVV